MRRLLGFSLCVLTALATGVCAWASPSISAIRAARLLVPDYSQSTGGFSPALSPDGRTVAYITLDGDVYLMHGIDSYGPKLPEPWKLPRINGVFVYPYRYYDWRFRALDWSPDGSKLVYCPGNGPVYYADNIDYEKKTARVHELTSVDAGRGYGPRAVSVRWSPDGSKVVFVREMPVNADGKPQGWEVCVADFATKKLTILEQRCDSRAADWQQPWSPDGSRVAYMHCDFGGSMAEAYLSDMSVTGQQYRRLKPAQSNSSPSWSPTGEGIAVVTGMGPSVKLPPGTALGSVSFGLGIGIQNPQTGAVKWVTNSVSGLEMRRLAARLNARFKELFKERFGPKLTKAERNVLESGKLTIDQMYGLVWLVSARGVGGDFQHICERILSNKADAKDLNDPGSKASKVIAEALKSLPEAQAAAFRSSVWGIDTELHRWLNDNYHKWDDGNPVWSPDGKRIAFIRADAKSHSSRLCVLDLASKKVTSVFEALSFDSVTWSKDGTALVMVSRRAVSAMPTAIKMPNGEQRHYTQSAMGYPEIWRIDLELGQPAPLEVVQGQQADQSSRPVIPGPLDHVYVAPLRVGLRPGASIQLKLCGADARGYEAPVTGDVVWHADSQAGTISPTGLFTAARTPGVYVDGISASLGHMSSVACVEVLSSTPSAGFVLDRTIGGPMAGQLGIPTGVAVDRSGCVYVTDGHGHRVLKFDAAGKLLRTWGSFGSDQGQFQNPSCVAVDGEDNIYVGDWSNNRVQKFDPWGKFLLQFGSCDLTAWPRSPEMLTAPSSIAFDSAGNVYIGSRNAVGVSVFDRAGKFLRVIGSRDKDGGELEASGGVAVDAAGNVYVSDSWLRARILKFDQTGKLIKQWNTRGPSDPDNSGASQLVLAPDGKSLYSLSDGDRLVKRFDLDGNLVCIRYSSLMRTGTPMNINGIASDLADNLLIADGESGQVFRIDADGKCIATWGTLGVTNGNLSRPRAVAVEKDGNVLVTDDAHGLVQRFDASLSFIAGLGPAYGLSGGIAAGPSGDIYLSNWDNWVRWDSSGKKIDKIGSRGSGEGQFDRSSYMTTDAAGNLYVSDSGNRRIQKLDSSGHYLAAWNAVEDPEKNSYCWLGAICTGPSGSVYVVEQSQSCVRKFDSTGKFIKQWKVGDGQLASLTVDADERIYVGQCPKNRILVFDADSNSLGELLCGSLQPGSIASGQNGEIYAVDANTSMVARFVRVDAPEVKP